MGNFPSKISPEEAVKKDQIVKTTVLFKRHIAYYLPLSQLFLFKGL
jgi:hypothetical protein